MLGDELATLARQARLVTNSMGVEASTSSAGVSFTAKDPNAWETLQFFIGARGAIVAEGPVGATGGNFASSQVTNLRLSGFVEHAREFALAVWERIDAGHAIRQAAVTIAIPDAQQKIFATRDLGSSMSVSMTLPQTVVAPEPARICQREDIGGPELGRYWWPRSSGDSPMPAPCSSHDWAELSRRRREHRRRRR